MILDEEQHKAVYTTDSKVLVVAGAGSGKTRVITERVRYLMENGVDPYSIICITYTNMAASEMRERLCDIDNIGKAFIGTIHSLANKIYRNSGVTYTIVETDEEVIDETTITFYDLLERALTYSKTISMDINHLLVDEFQDIGRGEVAFIQGLNAKNTFFVGDDWQAIYGFKGGDVRIFKDLIKDQAYTTLFLTNNYRSGKAVIDYGNLIISQVDDKIEKTTNIINDNKGKVILRDKDSLGIYIDYIKETKRYGNWFILTRFNAEIAYIKKILIEEEIPHSCFKKHSTTPAQITRIMRSNTVKLLTIHTAKGLECKNVILYGYFPTKGNGYNDEERKAMYVGVTRAKHNLVVLHNPNNKRNRITK